LQAIEAYEASLRLNPYQTFVLLDLARTQDLAGETDRALTTFKKAIEVYPANPVAHFQLGCFYRDHSELDRAREAFAQSQKLYPSTGAELNLKELEPKTR
jgi:tetratricopeptide (TPR) repeat protein